MLASVLGIAKEKKRGNVVKNGKSVTRSCHSRVRSGGKTGYIAKKGVDLYSARLRVGENDGVTMPGFNRSDQQPSTTLQAEHGSPKGSLHIIAQLPHADFIPSLASFHILTDLAVLRERGHQPLQYSWFRAAVKLYNSML
eukprot:246126-Pelagomonas_calceolata.AAC.1